MSVRDDLDVRQRDTYLSRWYAVVLDGAAVDLTTGGWTIRAQARQDGVVVIDWTVDGVGGTAGARILHATIPVTVGGQQLQTSALRLYLTPEATAGLGGLLRPVPFDVEISNPTFGPLDDLYRVTLVGGAVRVGKDVTAP